MEQEQIVTQVVNLGKLVEYRIKDKLFLAKDSLIKLAEHIHGDNNVFLVNGNYYFEGTQHERYNWITQEVLPKVYSVKDEEAKNLNQFLQSNYHCFSNVPQYRELEMNTNHDAAAK